MLFNSVFTIFWDFNIQCRVCYTACSVNRRETVSLFKFPIKSLTIPFELNLPVSLITIYILYVIITRDQMARINGPGTSYSQSAYRRHPRELRQKPSPCPQTRCMPLKEPACPDCTYQYICQPLKRKQN